MRKRLRKMWSTYGPEIGKRSEWVAWPDNETVLPGIHPPLHFQPRQVIGGKTWSLTLFTRMAVDRDG